LDYDRKIDPSIDASHARFGNCRCMHIRISHWLRRHTCVWWAYSKLLELSRGGVDVNHASLGHPLVRGRPGLGRKEEGFVSYTLTQ
jgi:hypothetical protein